MLKNNIRSVKHWHIRSHASLTQANPYKQQRDEEETRAQILARAFAPTTGATLGGRSRDPLYWAVISPSLWLSAVARHITASALQTERVRGENPDWRLKGERARLWQQFINIRFFFFFSHCVCSERRRAGTSWEEMDSRFIFLTPMRVLRPRPFVPRWHPCQRKMGGKKKTEPKKSQAWSLFYLQGKRQTLDSTSWLMHVPSWLHSAWETCPSSPTAPWNISQSPENQWR